MDRLSSAVSSSVARSDRHGYPHRRCIAVQPCISSLFWKPVSFYSWGDNLAFANSEEFSWIREIVSSKELEVICEEIKSEIDAVGAESAAESFFVEQVQEEIPAERTLHFLLFQTDIDPYSRSVTD